MAKTQSLYEKVLAGLGSRQPAAPRPPRASASVVLWRRGEGGLEVFWIRRSPELPFMGGWHAFPGGGLSRRDAEVRLSGKPRGGEGRPSPVAIPDSLTTGLGELGPNLAPGIVACALRELLEETGVLPLAELAAPPGRDAVTLEAELGAARRALLDDGRGFAAVLAEYGLHPDPSQLVYAGRWLTPPLGPVRFDNRFFLLEWPRELPVQPLVVPGEVASGEWIPPAAGVERWWQGVVTAAPPIVHLLRVLAEDGPEAGLERLREPAEANLGPYRRVEFRPAVLLLPLPTATLPPATHTNAYLVGTGELVLVDPGTRDAGELGRLGETLAAAEREGHRVTAIWLTHHHRDHVGGVAALQRRFGLPVWAHAATAERLGRARIRVERLLADGERITLAGDPPLPVRVVHTPGHAPGHLCFLEEVGGSLLAGDMVSALSTIVVDPPEGNMDDYLASLERLVELGPTTLFPGHGPPLGDAVGKLREFIAHRLWREKRILAAWREGLRTPAEIRPRAYEDLDEALFPLAERQIVAHLERLERAGRLAPAGR
jgi:glyoxylase-like metal-dependent hydrolase (beta-lactamase superfamily II)/8-oxo-dGTP pyrophosphatase MutT (NUDIX family)